MCTHASPALAPVPAAPASSSLHGMPVWPSLFIIMSSACSSAALPRLRDPGSAPSHAATCSGQPERAALNVPASLNLQQQAYKQHQLALQPA